MRCDNYSNESKSFEKCLKSAVAYYEAGYNRTIWLPGDCLDATHMAESSFIAILPNMSKNTYKPFKAEIPYQIINIPDSFSIEMKDRCMDSNAPNSNSWVFKYVLSGNQVAVVDTLNNIFFIDFHHGNSNSFTVFDWILTDLNNRKTGTLYLDRFEQSIRNIDANRIERLVIETKFDIDHFVEEGKKQIESTIETQQATTKLQVDTIKRTLENERATVNRRIEDSSKKSFLEGIKSLKTGWVVENNRLVLKKTIYMDRFTLNGKDVKPLAKKYFTKNLSITIAPIVTAAAASPESKHPNISGSSVCIGDLDHKPLAEFMDKIEAQMKVGNLNSVNSEKYGAEGYNLFEDAKSEVTESKTSASNVWTLTS